MKSPFGSTLPPGCSDRDVDGPDQPSPRPMLDWLDDASTDEARRVIDLWWEENHWDVVNHLLVAGKLPPRDNARVMGFWCERLEAIYEKLAEKGRITP